MPNPTEAEQVLADHVDRDGDDCVCGSQPPIPCLSLKRRIADALRAARQEQRMVDSLLLCDHDCMSHAPMDEVAHLQLLATAILTHAGAGG